MKVPLNEITEGSSARDTVATLLKIESVWIMILSLEFTLVIITFWTEGLGGAYIAYKTVFYIIQIVLLWLIGILTFIKGGKSDAASIKLCFLAGFWGLIIAGTLNCLVEIGDFIWDTEGEKKTLWSKIINMVLTWFLYVIGAFPFFIYNKLRNST